MTGDEIAAARREMGLSRRQLGVMLGYKGGRETFKSIRLVEIGERNMAADLQERLGRLHAYWKRYRRFPPAEVIDGEA